MSLEELKSVLITNKKTLSVAESLTGGNLQAIFTSIDGSSNFFLGGLTAYTIEQKTNLLQVDKDNALLCNCVSAQTSIEMSKGISKLMGSDYSIATTGYVVPNDTFHNPFAYISVYDRELDYFIFEKIANFKFINRERSQKFFSEHAFNMFGNYIKTKGVSNENKNF